MAATGNYLTKSLFQLAVSCPRKLVYAMQNRRRRTETNVLLKSLAAEGRLWEAYARAKRFPNGVLVDAGSKIEFQNKIDTDNDGEEREVPSFLNVSDALISSQAKRTQQILFPKRGGESRPAFEGLIWFKNFLIRTDVLECITYYEDDDPEAEKKRKIRLTEIKTKSFDSRSEKDPIWSQRGKGIRTEMLSYIQDVAFQTMVLRNLFPNNVVESYLLLPDKAKINSVDGLNQFVNTLSSNFSKKSSDPVVEEAFKAIVDSEEDLTAMIDVTEAVNFVLKKDPLFLPGGGKSLPFHTAAVAWARYLSNTATPVAAQPPLGLHCRGCEFRLEDAGTSDGPTDAKNTNRFRNLSGFHQCWTERTGLRPTDIGEDNLVIDMWYGHKHKIKTFIEKEKFLLSDLDHDDLSFTEDGRELVRGKIAPKRSHGITRAQRQLYQAHGVPSGEKFIGEREYMQEEMQKWAYPYHFVDFETATPVVPYFSGMAPFGTVAFQFSHHIMQEDGTVEHCNEFLQTEPGVNPNESFAHALMESVGSREGSVFCWGAHENTILKAVLRNVDRDSEVYSKLNPLLTDGGRAMVDLKKMATKGYFVMGSSGSSSIKKLLLPTMDASTSLERIYGEPSYTSKNFSNVQWYQRGEDGSVIDPYQILKAYEEELEGMETVADGGAALSAFHVLQSPNLDSTRREQLRSSLLRYCELDTLAMVMICQAWQEFFLDK